MTSERRLRWVATVGCEGGPVMVADLPQFGRWTGAAPYAELRKMSEAIAALVQDRMCTLHYWGQFTDELPEPFAADGGHQYVRCATEAEARAKLAELCTAVTAKLPTVEISQDGDDTHFLLPGDDEDRQMWAELAPSSEYDASWQAHEGEDAWIHEFGKNERGLFWDMGGPGVADVGVSADGREIVIVRSWVDDEKDEEEVHALVDAPHDDEAAAGELAIGSGKAVVVWSPVAPFQISGVDGPDALANLADGDDPPELDTEMIGGVGTILRVRPGRWLVTTASNEDDDRDDDRAWSCRWCRLKWAE